uniref:Uncharacterized protein n=1 Tax=Magallana gigas TaxID=29159 RepID=K1QMB0_MAGGI
MSFLLNIVFMSNFPSGFEIKLQDDQEWSQANHTCTMELAGGLLSTVDAIMDPSLKNISTPKDQYYWSSKTTTFTDFIQYEGCFNSSLLEPMKMVLPSLHPVAACFDYCDNTSRIGLTISNMMEVYCLCLEEGAIAHTRDNISSCNVPCPNDIMMNTCGSKDSMSVYYRDRFDAPNPKDMVQCVAIKTSGESTSLLYDDCRSTNDGYICDICDDDQCSKEVYSEGVKLTWDEAQQACQKRGGYLGNFGSAKNKTVWTGYKRWFLDDSYSENIPVRSWFDAEQNCELSNSRLLNGSELYERKLEEDIYISHYYWTYGFAEFTSCVRSIGCYDISNSSGMSSAYGAQRSILGCLEFCKGSKYFGVTKENVTQDKCICIENITDLTLSNASECMTSCADDSNDTCGAEGRMILHEIGDNDRENCTHIAYQGMYNWYEASVECRDKGGNLGDSSFNDFSSLSDGAYWYGWRRWLLKQNPTGVAPRPDKNACESCRISNGQLHCTNMLCSEMLQGICTEGTTQTTIAGTTTTRTLEDLTSVTYNTGSDIRTTIKVSTKEPQPESGNTKPKLEQDDMTANIIAVVIAVAIIGAVVAVLVLTKLRKSEKVTSDVTDLIDTKNGPIKFSTLRDSTSRPPSFNHSPLERQRSFSNPSFMDHDIDILAQNLEQEPQQDTEQLQKEN